MQQWTFTIERELMKNTALRLSYIGNHGSNLEQRLAWNSAESALNYENQTGLQVQPGANGTDLRRPNVNWNGTVESHVGYSNSNSVQAQVERRFSSGLSFQWSYTYDHILTTTDSGGFSDGSDGALVPLNSTIFGDPNLTLSQRLKLVYANSGQVPPQMIKWNGIYELPFGKGKHFGNNVSGALNEIVGGWQVAFIGSWQSGSWMGVNTSTAGLPSNSEYLFGNPTLNSNQQLTMNIFGLSQQLWFKGDFDPTQATNVNLSQLEQLVPVNRGQRVLHPLGSDFSNLVPVKLANGQTVLTSYTDNFTWNPGYFFLSPSAWNEDLSLFKYFEIKERLKLRVTADFFNALNHPEFYLPGSLASGGPNNLNTNTGLLNLSKQVNSPRIIQFTARLEF
jgi:hypothetical protein